MRLQTITCAVVFGLATLSANGDIVTDRLSLTIQPDGETFIHNGTDSAVGFCAYEITSPGLTLDPVGWRSIADANEYAQQAAGGGDFGPIQELADVLGSSSLTLNEVFASTEECLAELTVSEGAVLQPGTSWSIGYPFLTLPTTDITFRYSTPDGSVVQDLPSPLTGKDPGIIGDADGDGDVDLEDFQIVRENFCNVAGATWGQGNFDGDDDVDIEDLYLITLHYTGAGMAPEPTSATLMLLGLAAAARRRKR